MDKKKQLDDIVKQNLNNWLAIEDYAEALNLASRYGLHSFAHSISKLYIPELKQSGEFERAYNIAQMYVPSEISSCARLHFTQCKAQNKFLKALSLAREHFPSQENKVKDMYVEHLFKENTFTSLRDLMYFVQNEYTQRFDEIYGRVYELFLEREDYVSLFNMAYEFDDIDTQDSFYRHFLAQSLRDYEQYLLDAAAQKDIDERAVLKAQAKTTLGDLFEVYDEYHDSDDTIFFLPDLDNPDLQYESSRRDLEMRVTCIKEELERCKNNPRRYELQKDFNAALLQEDYRRVAKIKSEMDGLAD